MTDTARDHTGPLTEQSRARHMDDYLADAVHLLWPAEVSDRSETIRLLALPSSRAPRLLVPRRPWRVAAGALRHYQTSARGLRRAGGRAGSLGLHLGVTEILPARFCVPARDGIEDLLRVALRREVRVALYVGPPRAIQKPVLLVLDTRGRTVAFAKVSVNDLTTRLIRHEARTLDGFADAPIPGVVTPRVLLHDTWRGRELLVQEALRAPSSARVPEGQAVRAAVAIAGSRGCRTAAMRTSAYVGSLARRQAALSEHPLSRLLSSSLHGAVAAEPASGDVGGPVSPVDPNPVMSFGSWHGDWTPWNMAASGDQVLVWDWEGFRPDVPIGFDECHRYLNVLVAQARQSAVGAVRALIAHRHAVLAPMGVEPGAQAWTVLLYVHELATSYLENGEDMVGGTTLSRLPDWLPAAIRLATDAAEGRRP